MQYLEGEGGYFKAIYKSVDQQVELRNKLPLERGQSVLADTKKDENVKQRALYTTIYYLMEKANSPCINKSDIIIFYHEGCPVKYYWLDMETKKLEHAVLGLNVAEGQHLQLMVPRGVLKWAEVLDDGVSDRCSFISLCVMPGFEFEDRTTYSQEQLEKMFPDFWEDIRKRFP